MSNTSDPALYALAITPDDVAVIAPTRGIYVGVAGNLTVRMYGQKNTVVFSNVPVGVFPIQVDQVFLATTATNLVALW